MRLPCSAVARIKVIAPRGVNFSFDTTGNEQVLADAIDSLAMGGECGIVTVPHHGAKFPFTPRGLFVRTATLRGIMQGSALPNIFLPKLIALQQRGRFPYERLIKTYDFADINQAFKDSEADRTIKPVLKM
jgi:aryl-alcohol dehydrogenase